MTVAISVIDREALRRLIQSSPHVRMEDSEFRMLDACLVISTNVFVGLVDGQYACCWGLVPPTIMSDRAYLWLQTSSLLEEHKFLFVRHSQRWIEDALLLYEEIVGFCRPDNASAIRWIEWLGGEFKRPFGSRADFVIRRDHGRSGHASYG